MMTSNQTTRQVWLAPSYKADEATHPPSAAMGTRNGLNEALLNGRRQPCIA